MCNFGWLCFTSYRQRGNLETEPPFTVPYTVRTGNQTPGRPLHPRCATPAPLIICVKSPRSTTFTVFLLVFSLYVKATASLQSARFVRGSDQDVKIVTSKQHRHLWPKHTQNKGEMVGTLISIILAVGPYLSSFVMICYIAYSLDQQIDVRSATVCNVTISSHQYSYPFPSNHIIIL